MTRVPQPPIRRLRSAAGVVCRPRSYLQAGSAASRSIIVIMPRWCLWLVVGLVFCGGLRFSHPRVFPTTGPVCDGLRPSFFHFYPTFPDVIPSFDMFFSIPVTKEKHGETPERAPRECHGKCPEVRNEREAPGVVGQGRSCG